MRAFTELSHEALTTTEQMESHPGLLLYKEFTIVVTSSWITCVNIILFMILFFMKEIGDSDLFGILPANVGPTLMKYELNALAILLGSDNILLFTFSFEQPYEVFFYL